MKALPIALLLVCGCVTRNTVTEEDRQGIHVTVQIVEAQDVELDRIEEAVKEDPKAMASVMPIVERMREKNSDARAITSTLIENFKPPQKPVTYTHAEVQGLLDRMKKSHSATFWGSLLTAVLTGGAAALTLARKYGKFIPGFGPVFAVVDSTMTAIEGWMQKQKAEGKADIAGGLAIALEAAHKDAKVGAWVDAKLEKVKEKIGVDVANAVTTL